MANETRIFSTAKKIEISPGCEVFETYGEIDVVVQIDPNYPILFNITVDSARWPALALIFVAPDYVPVV